jgi:hypothetical protein
MLILLIFSLKNLLIYLPPELLPPEDLPPDDLPPEDLPPELLVVDLVLLTEELLEDLAALAALALSAPEEVL